MGRRSIESYDEGFHAGYRKGLREAIKLAALCSGPNAGSIQPVVLIRTLERTIEEDERDYPGRSARRESDGRP